MSFGASESLAPEDIWIWERLPHSFRVSCRREGNFVWFAFFVYGLLKSANPPAQHKLQRPRVRSVSTDIWTLLCRKQQGKSPTRSERYFFRARRKSSSLLRFLPNPNYERLKPFRWWLLFHFFHSQPSHFRRRKREEKSELSLELTSFNSEHAMYMYVAQSEIEQCKKEECLVRSWIRK